MPAKTIIYGEIVKPNDKQQILSHTSYDSDLMIWKNDPVLLGQGDLDTVVYVDLDNPLFSKSEFLISLATAGTRTRVVGKSESADMDDLLRLSKLGVSEIIDKEDCLLRLNSFLDELEQIKKSDSDNELTEINISGDPLIGNSVEMAQIRKNIEILSSVDFPSALILGETGTGKSLISKVLHQKSTRAKNNFVEVNCSAIPDELFESELFGYVKGAFTDAREDKKGLFEHAKDGTIFLDEVGNLSLKAQAKLLKILEDKKIRKIGAVEDIPINVRIVAATNLDLRKAVEEGKFRADLFFRINLLTIEIPPLRRRKSEIVELIDYYLKKYIELYAKEKVSFDKSAMDELQNYNWPGNVRELCNVIERMVLLSDNKRIGKKDILGAINKSRLNTTDRKQLLIELPADGLTLENIEQQIVQQVLNLCKWNKTETAKYLHISRPRLRRIIEAAGLKDTRKKS